MKKRIILVVVLMANLICGVIWADNTARLAELSKEQNDLLKQFQQLENMKRKVNEQWVEKKGAIDELRRQDAAAAKAAAEKEENKGLIRKVMDGFSKPAADSSESKKA